MRRAVYLMLVVCVASVIAGWAIARMHASFSERASAEKAEAMALIAAKRPAKYFDGLVRGADEVVISYDYAHGPGRQEFRSRDRVSLSRLANILGRASYSPTPPALWISTSEIRIYRMHEQVLGLMTNGKVLRCLEETESGDFIVGLETTSAISALASEIKSDQDLRPTSTAAMSTAGQEPH